MADRPREIFVEWHAESFGSGAHQDWYRDVLRMGPHGNMTAQGANDWWLDSVRIGDGYYSYGMRFPETQAEIDEAYMTYWSLFAELMRDFREDERERPTYLGLSSCDKWDAYLDRYGD